MCSVNTLGLTSQCKPTFITRCPYTGAFLLGRCRQCDNHAFSYLPGEGWATGRGNTLRRALWLRILGT